MRWAAVRPTIIAAMLGLTTVVAVVLTAEAAFATRYHRVTAERVLRDYAALGADGVAQRLKVALSVRFSPVLMTAANATEHTRAPVSVSELRNALSGNARDVLDDSSRIFRVTDADSLATQLRRETAALPGYAYFGMLWEPDSSLLVFQPFRDGRTPMAFTLPSRSAALLMSRLIANDRVLPASITHGASVDRGIGVRVFGGRRELANRRFDETSPYRASLPLEQPYGDLRVDVSLDASLAPALIIGGLPRSRLPIQVALLALTIALTIAAADQLRRERELWRLRDDFVSSVSHELRTPLAQIRMFAETLRLGRVRTPDERERSLAIVESEARRLEHLVENVLLISRAERRPLEVHPRETNLTSLIQEVVGEFAPLAARSEARVVLSLEPDVAATVDASAVRQILLNLLDNAVKYGRRGQTITVRLTRAGTRARLEVEDQGAGIAAEDGDRIWTQFWRGSAARQLGVAGTGIGLSIVRELVALHGGTAVVDTTLTIGARFVVELSCSDAVPKGNAVA